LGLENVTNPLLLGPDNMPAPRDLSLTIMFDPLFLGLESCLTHAFLQWATRFSRRREGKEGGREKPPPRAHSWASLAHAPCHYA